MPKQSITIKLLPHQKQFIKSTKPYTCMVCGRGSGKTYVASILAAIKLLKGERIIMFAQSWASLTENLMKEVVNRLDEIIPTDSNSKLAYKYNRGGQKIELGKGVIYGATYESQDAIRGYTQISTLILDEAALSKPDILEVAAPCLRGLPDGIEPHIYCITTPKGSSWFNTWITNKLKNNPEQIDLIKARTIDNTFVSSAEYELMLASFSNQTVIKQELEGEILDLTAENSIISGVECRIGKEQMPSSGLVYVGIDGSGYGRDFTVLTFRINDAYVQYKFPQITGFDLRNKIREQLKLNPGWVIKRILIDQAYGQTYYENLYQEFENCELVNFASKPTDESQYMNIRAEGYFELVNAIRQGFKIDEEIKKELQATLFEFNQQGKLKLIQKDEIKEVLGHSPDSSDSLMLTFAYTTYKHYEPETIDTQCEIVLDSPED